eukprot:gene7042-biopygen4317
MVARARPACLRQLLHQGVRSGSDPGTAAFGLLGPAAPCGAGTGEDFFRHRGGGATRSTRARQWASCIATHPSGTAALSSSTSPKSAPGPAQPRSTQFPSSFPGPDQGLVGRLFLRRVITEKPQCLGAVTGRIRTILKSPGPDQGLVGRLFLRRVITEKPQCLGAVTGRIRLDH